MRLNPIEIRGNWDKGYVLDKHMQDETRTELGELLFHLKYRGKLDSIDGIMEMISPFLDSFRELKKIDKVVPVPSSKFRDFQPVDVIAMAVSEYLGVDFTDEILEKTTSEQAKNMKSATKKLKGSIRAKIQETKPHSILLIDDLYETGGTLKECVSVLRDDPLLENIYVLAMTKTR
jgi:predicted amidophosphoribosyltransferase